MSRGRGGRTKKYPSGLVGPKSHSIVFAVDVRPMVEIAIKDNNRINENSFHHNATGGIEYIASEFRVAGGYVSQNAALRTMYRVLWESPFMGAHIADALSIACDTTLYAEDIREYPSGLKAAREAIFVEADEAGEILSPFDLEERATALWHETYERYLIEAEPFRENYAIQRLKRRARLDRQKAA